MDLRHFILLLTTTLGSCNLYGDREPDPLPGPRPIRVATFNVSLYRDAGGELADDLAAPGDPQASAVAEILQHIRPDIVLLNEFDHDPTGRTLELFRRNYLEVGQNGAQPLHLAHAFTAPVNTGAPSGFDLDRDGRTDGPADAFGFGRYPGQYGMVLLSRFPIDNEGVRTFRSLRWVDQPAALLPDDPSTPEEADWYPEDARSVFRLSSKSHWDVPVMVEEHVLHALCAHPTPPAFDGPPRFPAAVDFNGRRNHDEIRMWVDYVTPGSGSYLVDDAGVSGGLDPESPFIILGDYNADPLDGDPVAGSPVGRAGALLVECPRIRANPIPSSRGGLEASRSQGGANLAHRGDPGHDTADFGDRAPGNLRVDYALPSIHLEVLDCGVFWPTTRDPLYRLIGADGKASSDHRLVWVDVLPVEPFGR